MTSSESALRQLALGLMRCAMWILPNSRTEWAKAMHSELSCMESDYRAIHWAIGCVITGIKERVNVMAIGDLRTSRWVLVPELALCFVPLTIAWLDSLFGAFGVVRLYMEMDQQYLIGPPEGIILPIVIFSGAILGALGPIGLLVAFRLIALGRRMRSRILGAMLIAGPILLGVIYVGGSVIAEGPQTIAAWAPGILLLFVLPVLGTAHILYLGQNIPEHKLAARPC